MRPRAVKVVGIAHPDLFDGKGRCFKLVGVGIVPFSRRNRPDRHEGRLTGNGVVFILYSNRIFLTSELHRRLHDAVLQRDGARLSPRLRGPRDHSRQIVERASDRLVHRAFKGLGELVVLPEVILRFPKIVLEVGSRVFPALPSILADLQRKRHGDVLPEVILRDGFSRLVLPGLGEGLERFQGVDQFLRRARHG